MRVGIDVHTLQGGHQGIRTYVARVARELVVTADQDAELVLIGCDKSTAKEFVPDGPWTSSRWLFDSPWIRIPLEAPIREITLGLDVLHSQYICPPWSARPEVVTIHDILFESHPDWFPAGFVRRNRILYRHSARKARIVVTDSEFSKGELIQQYDLPGGKVRVVPLGSDHISASLKTTSSDLGGWRGLPTEFILFVGRIDPRKNLTNLAAAYRILSQQYHDVPPLVLVGAKDFQFAKTLGAFAPELKSGRVIHLENVDDATVARLYKKAQVVVYPTLAEGFGLPVLEAMAVGAAIVTSPCSAIREYADGCVLYADPMSPKDLAETLERALNGGSDIIRIREAARARARGYTWRQVALKLWEIYKEAAA